MPTNTTNQQIRIPVPGDLNDVPADMAAMLSGGGTPANGLEGRLVQRFQSIVDRTTRNPSPIEGELSYLADLNRYETYTGSAWLPLVGTTAFAADTTVITLISSTSYILSAPLTGVTITVPPSGQVRVDWSGGLDNGLAANITFLAPQLNNGSTVGAGATITAATDDISIRNHGSNIVSPSGFYIYSGLTPGNAVNAFLMHRVDGGANGIVTTRKIALTQV